MIQYVLIIVSHFHGADDGKSSPEMVAYSFSSGAVYLSSKLYYESCIN